MRRGRVGWFQLLGAALQRRVLEVIDADAENAAEVFRRFNLQRFIAGRTFREFVKRRRREREARRIDGGESATGKPVTPAELEQQLMMQLSAALDAGWVRGSFLREIRLLLTQVRGRRGGETEGETQDASAGRQSP